MTTSFYNAGPPQISGDVSRPVDHVATISVDTAEKQKSSFYVDGVSSVIDIISISAAQQAARDADEDRIAAQAARDSAVIAQNLAAGSATSAAASAATMGASVAAAATSAASAATSASTAASAATSAAASYDSFDDRYLGPKATPPTVDNDGNALLTGALYWNSSTNLMYAYNGSAWVAVTPTTAVVSGPVSSTNRAIPRFSGTTGAVIQNSVVTISDAGVLAGAVGLDMPSAAQTLSISPVGNGFTTLASVNVIGSAVSNSVREFMVHLGMNVSTGAGATAWNKDKVCLYAGIVANSGGGDVWAINPLVQLNSGWVGSSHVIEADINNSSGTHFDSLSPSVYGISITGASSHRKTAALHISEFYPRMWNYGVLISQSCAQYSFCDFTDTPTCIYIGNITGDHRGTGIKLDAIFDGYGIDLSGAITGNQILLRNNCSILWNNAAGSAVTALTVDNNDKLNLGASISQVFTNANFGIGTSFPTAKLIVNLNASIIPAATAPTAGTITAFIGADAVTNRIRFMGFAQRSAFEFYRANNTGAAPTALAANDQIGAITSFGYGATAYSTNRASMQMFAGEAWTDTQQGAYISLMTTTHGAVTITERVRIAQGVSIGTTSDPGAGCLLAGVNIAAGGLISCNAGYYYNGNQVVGARGAAVADATDAASAITQLNAWLARARVHGLIA